MNRPAAPHDPAALREKARETSRASVLVLLGSLAALWLWSYRGSEVDMGLLFSAEGGGALFEYAARLFPPDLSRKTVADAAAGAWETFAISLMGTLLAAVIALSLVFFGSRNLAYAGLLYEMETRRGLVMLRRVPYLAARAVLNLLRTVPEMLWALVFVFLVGLGPFPGVLALGVHTGGVLGKLFAEVLEDVDLQPVESLQSTGAGKLQILFYGILPQALPQFVSYTLYRWEVNIRVAAVLGFVGAGGLGQRIHIAISLFHEQQLLTLLMVLYVLVTGVDYLSAYLRRRVV